MATGQVIVTSSCLNNPSVNEYKCSSSALERVLASAEVKSRKVMALRSRSQEAVKEMVQSITDNDDVSDPFYVLDLGVVVDLWHKWQEALPTVCPFYAVKCNPEPALLSALATLGSGFDCASRVEIEAILKLGVSPDRIVYANPCKAVTHLKYAASVGAGGARIPLGRKYGALPEEVEPLLQAAQESGLAVHGVSFHVGSSVSRSGIYSSAIATVRDVFDSASRHGMPKLSIVNIGGGFTAGQLFAEAASTVRKSLKTYFPDETKIFAMGEPGRYFAASAFWLASCVIGKRVREEVREYWINDGIHGSMSCLIHDKAVITAFPLACKSHRSNASCTGLPRYPSTVFGPTCDASDIVLIDYLLPELVVGDWLVFPNMGAYAAVIGTNFNGFSVSAIPTYCAASLPH
eukprot:PITA_31090